MREILFRGKAKDGSWVYGSYVQDVALDSDEIEHMIISHDGCHAILPETLGQYTGIKDANGKKIFEGDKLHHDDDIMVYINFGEHYVHENRHSSFGFSAFYDADDGAFEASLQFDMEDAEVIGNIHEDL